ncbi:transcriptional regulator [Streptomyces sp. CB02923]|uniref:helix-turn-helix domain-containing protein n=1 Tax=Streptomyces sp. CB02923 TaxID=1718985 RepID=UPI0009403867|nr:helix-turn-helix transcriptional regulator [Streptomyces sp. CB02923]OKI04917.1 transcriptional regulator [Streptomyces sp. CB02923]
MVAPDLPIGDRIRHYRKSRQQDVVAGLVGITPDYLSQIERGLKVPSLQILYAIARELGVPIAALLSDEAVTAPAPPPTAETSVVRALMGYGPALSTPPSSPRDLRERIEAAWRSWQTSPTRFTDAAQALPVLIAEVEHSVRAHRSGPDAQTRRQVLRAAADLYFLLRSYLRRTGRLDLSLMVADRAVRAAEDADDPLRVAAAQWNLGHVLLATDETDGAEHVAMHGIETLHAEVPASVEREAMTGALHLVTVVAASRRRDWTAARDRLRKRAAPAAANVGEGNFLWTVFGPTNVDLHRVSVEMEAGEVSEALHLADKVDTARVQSIEREFTFTLEVARCYDLRREDAATLLHLLQLESLAPEDLARTPMARALVLSLIRRARAMHARQAESLAHRLGVL